MALQHACPFEIFSSLSLGAFFYREEIRENIAVTPAQRADTPRTACGADWGAEVRRDFFFAIPSFLH